MTKIVVFYLEMVNLIYANSVCHTHTWNLYEEGCEFIFESHQKKYTFMFQLDTNLIYSQ